MFSQFFNFSFNNWFGYGNYNHEHKNELHHFKEHSFWGPNHHHQWGVHEEAVDSTSSDSSIIAGTAYSTYLTLDNATVSLSGDGTISQDGVTITHSTGWCGYSSTYITSDVWNESGYKSVQIINDDDSIYVNNIVDINIVNESSTGTDIDLINVKRATIETGSGDDDINISVYSNNINWNNTFTISTGDGNDSVVMSDTLNTKNTSFDVSLGDGRDTLDVSSIDSDSTIDTSRYADGGDGLDTLIFSGQDTVEFENFEVIKGSDDAGLTIDSELLESNDSSYFGLVLSNVDVSFDDSVTVADTDDLSWAETAYLCSLGLNASDYSSLTVTADDGSTYHLLTDDTDYASA
ncbi:hypothetical protein [Vibrio viridaestus]|uniref:Uncharacterized protein n=1 Tax=Vibrio viridaestus TaxID=2487322 RepID=A0A3N9TJZ7_9VIBR|nr:hypothetical protein [Vibrio viridaestus]RQW63895.1 hypothetical protein EES38_04620 [Vibrio viridaestus]